MVKWNIFESRGSFVCWLVLFVCLFCFVLALAINIRIIIYWWVLQDKIKIIAWEGTETSKKWEL